MSRRTPQLLLEDILDSSRKILEYTSYLSFPPSINLETKAMLKILTDQS